MRILNVFVYAAMVYIMTLTLTFGHFFLQLKNQIITKMDWSLRQWLAIYSLLMYCVDTGSDIFVSVNLFLSCHYFYGTSVLSIVFLPGLVYGWYQYSQGDISFKKALIFPIWFMPYSLRKLWKGIFDHSFDNGKTSNELDGAKL